MSALAVRSFLLSLIVVPPAHADEATPALSAAELVERVQAGHPRVALAEARVQEARVAVDAARELENPALDYQREQLLGDSEDTQNTTSVLWTVDVSGQRGREIRAARAQVTAARARRERQHSLLIADALDAYYRAAYARDVVALLGQTRRPLDELVAAARAQVEAGDAAAYDLERLELELADVDQQVAEAREELAVAQVALGAFAGEQRRYRASDPLTLPALPAPGDEVARAVQQRPDVRAAQAEAVSATAALAAARRAWIPDLGLGLGWRNTRVEGKTGNGYFAQITVELPIFARGQTEARRARAARAAAAAQLRLLEREIPAEIATALARLHSRVARARAQLSRAERAAALVTTARARYRAGEGSVAEVVDAYRLAHGMRARALELTYAARRAWLDVWRALGRQPKELT